MFREVLLILKLEGSLKLAHPKNGFLKMKFNSMFVFSVLKGSRKHSVIIILSITIRHCTLCSNLGKKIIFPLRKPSKYFVLLTVILVKCCIFTACSVSLRPKTVNYFTYPSVFPSLSTFNDNARLTFIQSTIKMVM